jgi:hypothetical protein
VITFVVTCQQLPVEPSLRYVAVMTAQLVSAIAAVAAAIVSLVNVGLSSILVRRQDSQRWKREQLPDLVEKLADAAFQWERKIFESDWRLIPEADRTDFGMDEAREAMQFESRLEVFAAPRTISTAREMLHAVDAIRMHNLKNPVEPDGEYQRPWNLYWEWSEARYAFLKASRREMGLKPPPVPPGLSSYRERSRTTNPPSRKLSGPGLRSGLRRT